MGVCQTENRPNLAPNLALADDFELPGGQFADPHGAAGVQTVRGDAHFGPEAELAAVGEAGAGVPVDAGAVDLGEEGAGGGFVGRDDGVGVVRAVVFDMGDRLGEAGDDLDVEDEAQVFGAEILFGRGLGADGPRKC